MELKLDTVPIEIVTDSFTINGGYQPRGELMTNLNDKRFTFFNITDTILRPQLTGYQIKSIPQPSFNINRNTIIYFAVKDEIYLEKIQIMQAKREIVVYTDNLAIRGNFHTNPDARNTDLFDETRDFAAMTDVSIYPLRPMTNAPTRSVPFLAISWRHVTAYHTTE